MTRLPSDFDARGRALSTAVQDAIDGFSLTPIGDTSSPEALARGTARATGLREGREQALAEGIARARAGLADRLRRAALREQIAAEAREARDQSALVGDARTLAEMLWRRPTGV